MLTAEKKKKYTAEDYMIMEEGSPFQLINYDLIMSPAPSLLHQLILSELNDIIKAFVKKNDPQGMVVFSAVDIFFNDGNVLQPDLIYISATRKAEIVTDKINGAPELVVEILSPSNAYYDLRQKKDLYEKFGVKEYIIIDPIAQNADLYILKDGAFLLHQKAQKTEVLYSILLPGLSFALAQLFQF